MTKDVYKKYKGSRTYKILDGKSLASAFRAAAKYESNGQLDKALNVYQGILKKFPKNKMAAAAAKAVTRKQSYSGNRSNEPDRDKLQHLLSLFQQGKMEQALKTADRLTSEYPKSAKLYNIHGAILNNLRQYDHAIESYKRAISLDPNDPQAFYNMGNTLKESGEPEKALQAFKKALSIRPMFFEAYFNTGNTLHEMGQLDWAIINYKKAIEINPKFPEVYYNLAIALIKKDNLNEGLDNFEHAHKIKPDFSSAYIIGSTLLKKQKFEKALGAFDKAISVNSKNGEVYIDIGFALHKLGRLDAAIQAYQKSIQLKPDNVKAYYNMGNAFKQKGSFEQAIMAFNTALKIDTSFFDAHYNLGNTYKKIGQLSHAVASLKKAIALRPDHADAHNNLGVALREQGNLKESIIVLKKILELYPNCADAYNNIAATLQEQGKLDDAIVALEKVLVLDPDHAEAHNNFGVVLQNQGKLESSLAAFQKAIDIDPDHARAHLNSAYSLLNLGRVKEGLDKYEWRWQIQNFIDARPKFTQSAWDGRTSLKDKTILIWSEQGIGDTINWSSRLSILESQADHCILECPEKLVALMKRSFPNIEVKTENRNLDLMRNDFDFHIPLGSIAKYVISKKLPLQQPHKFLRPDLSRVKFWSDRLHSLGKGPYIGICWKSSGMTPARRFNYAPLKDWSPLLKLPNVTFVNLQYKDFKDDLRTFENEFGVHVHNFEDLDQFNDVDDVAALCTALSFVVSTTGLVPLISSGVGTPTKLALWRQSSINNVLYHPSGPDVKRYERDTLETWENLFRFIAEDIVKITSN